MIEAAAKAATASAGSCAPATEEAVEEAGAAMGEAVAADVDRAVRSRRNPGRIRSRCPWRLARRPGRPR